MEKYSLRQAVNEADEMQKKVSEGKAENYSEAEQQVEDAKQQIEDEKREMLEKAYQQKDYDEVATNLLSYLNMEVLYKKAKQQMGENAPKLSPMMIIYGMHKIIEKDPQFFTKNNIQLNEEEEALIDLFNKVNEYQLSTSEATGGGSTHKMESLLPKELQSNEYRQQAIGITDIVSATIDSRFDLQPCGVKVIELLLDKKIPSVVVSGSNHGKGSGAAYAASEYLNKIGALSGELLNENDIYNIKHGGKEGTGNVNVFHMKKAAGTTNPERVLESWQLVFDEIKRKLNESKSNEKQKKILIVEDNPRVIETIKKAMPEEKELEFATDYVSAEEKLRANDYMAVISDLFMPYDTESQDKSFGEKACLDVISSIIGKDEANRMMSEARESQSGYESAVQDSYHKFSSLRKKFELNS